MRVRRCMICLHMKTAKRQRAAIRRRFPLPAFARQMIRCRRHRRQIHFRGARHRSRRIGRNAPPPHNASSIATSITQIQTPFFLILLIFFAPFSFENFSLRTQESFFFSFIKTLSIIISRFTVPSNFHFINKMDYSISLLLFFFFLSFLTHLVCVKRKKETIRP